MNLFKEKCNNIADVKIVPAKKCIAIYDSKIEPVNYLRIITYKNSDIQIFPIMQSQAHGIVMCSDPSIEGIIYKDIPTIYTDSIPSARLNKLAMDIITPKGFSRYVGTQTHRDIYNSLCTQVYGLGLTVVE